MKALLYQADGKVGLREVPVPAIGAGEALIAVDACGLCGSDIVKLARKDLRPPVPLGHEVAGRVAALGPGASGLRLGQRVILSHHVPCFECHYCRHGQESMCREFKLSNLDPGGFAEFVRASARHVRHVLLPIPEGLSSAEASMTEPLSCCLRNVRRLGLDEGDTAVVVGLGFIGLLTSKLLLSRKVRVLGFDIDPQRAALARSLGVSQAWAGEEEAARRELFSMTEGRGADALVFTAGTPELAARRLGWLRDGGAFNVFASFHPSSAMTLDLNEVYHRELSVVASYSPQVQDLKDSLALLASRTIDVSSFTHSVFPLSGFEEALASVRSRSVVKALFLPSQNGASA